ncbi:hypothetical protein M0D21_18870 [Aquimarina sp. D1M17]|uniref:hypothetical protein n=1 Tax=Aquimarina acroporae TaxID=2937283 RepID=UPI0020BE9AAA|nr:hypothetical protein [Aquimarina acroporae]MCK8523654.1 hypothetical protein [Aquimarina acroporae]
MIAILSFFFLVVSCKEKKSSLGQQNNSAQETISEVVYEASTRGSFYKVIVNKNQVQKTKNRSASNFSSKTCSANEWKTVLSFTHTIDLNKIHELSAPTNQSARDVALHAKLKIITSSQTYTSVGFDHGNPPEELKSLVNTILTLAESIE